MLQGIVCFVCFFCTKCVKVNCGVAGIAKHTHKELLTLGRERKQRVWPDVYSPLLKLRIVVGLSMCLQGDENKLVLGGGASPLIRRGVVANLDWVVCALNVTSDLWKK